MILLGATRQSGYKVMVGSGLRKLGARVLKRKLLFKSEQYGAWHHIKMQARFSRTIDGYIRVYSDGDLKFEAVGRTVETQPYFKIGIYAQRDRIGGPLEERPAGLLYLDRFEKVLLDE